MQKDTKIAAAFCASTLALLLLTRIFPFGNTPSVDTPQTVSIENGIQVITITAKGGFSPEHIEAKSGLPTELHVVTNGTYDCSSTLVIPSLGYNEALKPTGTETITLAPEQAEGTLNGTCGMGMYSFDVAFK
ncbi:MAG: hypothetical protein QG626_798 [Patescibacteria group bacterium]|jgi:Cu+-exporting ATPase|nr:hypothetical protein [Patescibacteria group bacterium]